jgi:hypothetical protein
MSDLVVMTGTSIDKVIVPFGGERGFGRLSSCSGQRNLRQTVLTFVETRDIFAPVEHRSNAGGGVAAADLPVCVLQTGLDGQGSAPAFSPHLHSLSPAAWRTAQPLGC